MRPTQYLRRRGVMKRYGIAKMTFYRMVNHDDPLVRFPAPTLMFGKSPLWSLDDLDAYDKRQAELMREREPASAPDEKDRPAFGRADGKLTALWQGRQPLAVEKGQPSR